MSTPDGLPPLREVIRAAGLSAKKSLGQNFLLDFNLTQAHRPRGGSARRRDRRRGGPRPRRAYPRAADRRARRGSSPSRRTSAAFPRSRDIAALYPGRLDIVVADAREVDYAALAPPSPARIVANLPYSVGTPLLITWLKTEPWPPWFDRLVLMFQREVADRIVAAPGGKDLRAAGRALAVAHDASHSLTLPAAAFTPRPKVDFGAGRVRAPRDARRPLATYPCWRRSPPRPSAKGGRCCARRCGRSRQTARLCSSDSASTPKHAPKSWRLASFAASPTRLRRNAAKARSAISSRTALRPVSRVRRSRSAARIARTASTEQPMS